MVAVARVFFVGLVHDSSHVTNHQLLSPEIGCDSVASLAADVARLTGEEGGGGWSVSFREHPRLSEGVVCTGHSCVSLRQWCGSEIPISDSGRGVRDTAAREQVALTQGVVCTGPDRGRCVDGSTGPDSPVVSGTPQRKHLGLTEEGGHRT